MLTFDPATICTPDNLIGFGANREVFKVPGEDWVVKVDKYTEWEGEEGTNAYEWKTYLFLQNQNLPDPVRIPEMHFVDGYIIAQFIKGRHPSDGEYDWYSHVRDLRLYDMHNKNIIIDDDKNIWIVDIGGGSWSFY